MPPTFDWQVAISLGVLLAVALFSGGVAGYVRVPRVTAYLLVGVLLGPVIFHWVDREQVDPFEPLTKLAISLVLFTLGCHFPLARVRRNLRRTLRLSMGEMGLTFLLVTLGTLLLSQVSGGPIAWKGALLLGALALATAPATTVLVLKEAESEGPVTEYTNGLVALNNLAAIVLFELLFLGAHFFEGKLSVSVLVEVRLLAQDLVGSIALGMAAGLVVSYCYGLVGETRRLVLLFAAVILILGICELVGVPYLLTFLAMGITVVNTSDQTRQVLAELDRLTGLLCVVFFVAHGADLKLGALADAGLIGIGYIVCRLSGKYFGIRIAAAACGEEPAVRNWLGATLVAQAGAAIALAEIASHRDPEVGAYLQTVILGTVVFFELVGPIMIRQAVLKAGEVPLAHAIHRSRSLIDPMRTIWNRLLIAFGLNPWKNRSSDDLTVRELMRKDVKGIPEEATFDAVVAAIEHSRNDTHPVVGADGQLIGVIRYQELSKAMFDPALGALVRAADVTTPAGWLLHPDDPVARACDMFEASKDDCIPVVGTDKPYQLVGHVRRRDILRILIRGQIDVR